MTTAQAEADEAVAQYRGVIVIEWPPPIGGGPHGAMLGKLISITDAMTGELITACPAADVVVHADVDYLITADLTLYTDADGQPILRLSAVPDEGAATGVFPFLVAGMKVRQA